MHVQRQASLCGRLLRARWTAAFPGWFPVPAVFGIQRLIDGSQIDAAASRRAREDALIYNRRRPCAPTAAVHAGLEGSRILLRRVLSRQNIKEEEALSSVFLGGSFFTFFPPSSSLQSRRSLLSPSLAQTGLCGWFVRSLLIQSLGQLRPVLPKPVSTGLAGAPTGQPGRRSQEEGGLDLLLG